MQGVNRTLVNPGVRVKSGKVEDHRKPSDRPKRPGDTNTQS